MSYNFIFFCRGRYLDLCFYLSYINLMSVAVYIYNPVLFEFFTAYTRSTYTRGKQFFYTCLVFLLSISKATFL